MQRQFSISLPVLLALGLISCGGDDDDEPPQTGALIVTSDFQSGALSSIDLDSHAVSESIGTAHSDAICKSGPAGIYLVNRLDQDNIQVLDPVNGYRSLRQFSTGNGSNPQDICFLDETRAFVPLYGTSKVLIVNPTTGQQIEEVELGGFAAADGNPDMNACAVVDERVYVTLQNLQSFNPTGQSKMAVFGARVTGTVTAVSLQGQNPFTKIVHDEARNRLLFGTVGSFGVLDGGIEAFDLATQRSAGFVVTEQVLGGDVGSIALLSGTKGFAVITDASFATSLVSFNPQTHAKLATVYAATGFDLSGIALNDRDELYVGDANFTTPGVRIYNGNNDQSLVAQPLDVGLPPRDICFAVTE